MIGIMWQESYNRRRSAFACLLLAALAVAGIAGEALAQAGAAGDRHVVATLIAKSRNVVPGQPLQLALRQQIAPGWHTYWVNPGDSGEATTLDWTLPAGFKAKPIVWPTPVRFAYGPVVGYGYKNEVLLPVTIDVPSDLQPGTAVTLSAQASWLVCSDICLPEDAGLSISLPIGTASEPDGRWADAFALTEINTPVPNPFPATATLAGNTIVLQVATGDATRLRDIAFFPLDANVIQNDAPQAVTTDSKGLTLTVQRDRAAAAPATLNGVLTFRDLSAQTDGPAASIMVATPMRTASTFSALEFAGALILAVLGGVILNLMPCVLPVLSIKVFGLVQHAHAMPHEVRLQGLVYTAGVLTSFAIVAAALIGLRAAGAEIGWGFQLQSPVFVTAMIYVLFVVGLSLSGVFSFGDRLAGVGSGLAMRGGTTGSFFTGALATLVATPCTAPFMAAAMGYAITQPWYISLAVFEAVGLGLALPYLVIAFSPAARRWLPKPGAWMLRLKEFLAFPIYGTVVWLVFVLSNQTDALGVATVLSGLVLIALAIWLYEGVRASEGHARSWGLGASAASLLGAAVLVSMVAGDQSSSAPGSTAERGLAWQPFSQTRLDALRAEGRPVFVDFTAAWCITCKVNERVVLADPAVLKAMADANVAALRADWTRRDADIARVLAAHGRAGVPLYLFYPARDDRSAPVILPQILTTETVLRELRGG